MEERLFGRILLRTYIGEVFSLDLYETSDLVCRGVYVLPELRREGTRALAELELVAERDALEEVSRRLGATGLAEGRYLELRTEDMELYGEISPPIERGGRLIWAGALEGAAGGVRGEFDFMLEQFGSLEVALLLALLFRLVFAEVSVAIAWERCQQQAVRQCGEGNIKSVNVNKHLGTVNLVVRVGCQVECFERTYPT
jgi:hypothetical protein